VAGNTSTSSPFVNKGKLTAFLKDPLQKKRAGELLNLSRNQLCIMMGLLTGDCHLKEHLFELGLLHSPWCDRC
jgi:hypothetical protein